MRHFPINELKTNQFYKNKNLLLNGKSVPQTKLETIKSIKLIPFSKPSKPTKNFNLKILI